jgi:hypothetical protein
VSAIVGLTMIFTAVSLSGFLPEHAATANALYR